MDEHSLFSGKYIRLAAVDPERDVSVESGWTHNLDYARRVGGQRHRPLAGFEIQKLDADRMKQLEAVFPHYPFSVRRIRDDVFLGICQIENIQWSHGNALLNLYLGNPEASDDEWMEAMGIAVAYAFDELGLNRLGFVICENEASLAGYLERSGFLLEVRQREMVYRNGRFVDGLRYGILRQDWSERRELKNGR